MRPTSGAGAPPAPAPSGLGGRLPLDDFLVLEHAELGSGQLDRHQDLVQIGGTLIVQVSVSIE